MAKKLFGLFRDDSCFRLFADGRTGRDCVVHHIELSFVWFDLWVGCYVGDEQIYFCLLPTLVLSVDRSWRPWRRMKTVGAK